MNSRSVIFSILVFCLVSLVWAGPESISLQGSLSNADGPLTGLRAWRVQFYDAETGGNPLGAALTGSCTVAASGRWAIFLTPPAAVLDASGAVWYELAIDSAATPDSAIDAGDVFPDRVQVHSVLFARRADKATTATHAATADDADTLDGVEGADYATDVELTNGLAAKADTGHSHAFSEITGTATDAQIPDTITIDHADRATTATYAETATTATYAGIAGDADTLDGLEGADYATDVELTAGLAPKANSADVYTQGAVNTLLDGKSFTTHTHALQYLSGNSIFLNDMVTTPAQQDDRLYQLGDFLYWQGTQLNPEPLDTEAAANVNGDFRVDSGVDTILQNNLAVGVDAAAGMAFGYDTIILKENNLRILFQDTSNSGAFPTNDWRLMANDSANGGDSHFSIQDVDAGATPFRVYAGAPHGSLFIRGDGKIGVHTPSPNGVLDVCAPLTPSVDVSQTASTAYLENNYVAQTFQPTINGELRKVKIRLEGETVAVEQKGGTVYLIEGSDPSVSTYLWYGAFEVVTAFPAVIEVLVDRANSPVELTAGQTYTLKISRGNLTRYATTSDVYAGGQASVPGVFGPMASPWTAHPDKDLYFETYMVTPSAVDDSHSLVVSEGGNVGFGVASPQDVVHVDGPVYIEHESGLPTTITSRLYNYQGNLYWEGSLLETNPVQAINKDRLNDANTLGFDWADDEVADDLTISGGTVNNDSFSAVSDLAAEGKLDNDDGGDLLTRDQADGRYLNSTDKGDLATLDTVAAGQIDNGAVTEDKLAASLSFDDGDLLNLSAINASGTGEGLVLPQATDVSAAVAEGQISWDRDDDKLYVGDGSAVKEIGGSGGGGGTKDTITIFSNSNWSTGAVYHSFKMPWAGTIVSAQTFCYTDDGGSLDVHVGGVSALTGLIPFTNATVVEGTLKSNGDEQFSAGETIEFIYDGGGTAVVPGITLFVVYD